MTGQAPALTKLTDWITGAGDAGKPVREAEWIKKLPTATPNFASMFRDCGYRTIHIGKWHLGEPCTLESNPLKFGFDVNIGGSDVGTPPAPERYFASANGFSAIPNMGPTIAPSGSYLTDVLTQQAVAQIRQAAAGDTAFAMYLSHYAVHTLIQAPAATVAKYQAKLDNHPGTDWTGHTDPTYAAMVEHVDLSLGAVLAALEDPDGNPSSTAMLCPPPSGKLRLVRAACWFARSMSKANPTNESRRASSRPPSSASILGYIASAAFTPSVTMDDALVQPLFNPATSSSKPEAPKNDDPRKLGIVPGFNDGK